MIERILRWLVVVRQWLCLKIKYGIWNLEYSMQVDAIRDRLAEIVFAWNLFVLWVLYNALQLCLCMGVCVFTGVHLKHNVQIHKYTFRRSLSVKIRFQKRWSDKMCTYTHTHACARARTERVRMAGTRFASSSVTGIYHNFSSPPSNHYRFHKCQFTVWTFHTHTFLHALLARVCLWVCVCVCVRGMLLNVYIYFNLKG